MAPIPSPYFPEPVTVPGNVSDTDYRTVVRFTRHVALLHLASLGIVAAIAFLLSGPEATDITARLGAEGVWLLALAALVALALLRHGPLALQIVAFGALCIAFAALVAGLAPFLSDEFPDFTKAIGWTLGSSWIGLVLYNLCAQRDYSMLGEFVLVAAFTAVSLAVYTILTDVWFSQAFAVYIVALALLFYWIYDLAMILRRRTPKEAVAAAFDIYRDLLNFVGYPIRVMRMPRGRRRFQT